MGDLLEVTVNNNIGDQMTVIHWHGLTQRNSSWMDGPLINQCPINTIDPTTGNTLHTLNNITQLRYQLKPQGSGTWWYHGHMTSQPVDWLAGTLVVEDTQEILDAYKSHGLTYDTEVIFLLADYYQARAR